MKLRTAIALLRPAQAIFFASSIGFMTAGMGHFIFLRQQSLPARLWGDLLLLAPYYGGGMLNQFFHGVLHRPLAMTLPRVRRIFWTLQLPVLVAIAVGLGTVHAALSPTVPWPLSVSVAFLALTTSLPMEPGQAWRGSRWATTGITAVLLGLLIFADPVLHWVVPHWAAICLGCTGLGFTMVAWATDRTRLRARAFRLLLQGFDGLDQTQLQQMIAERARRGTNPRPVREPKYTFGRQPVAGDFRRLVQAAMVVTFGSAAVMRRLAVVMPLIMFALLLFFPLIPLLITDQALLGSSYLAQLRDIVWSGSTETGPVMSLMLGVVPLGAVVAVGARFAPLHALPLSRQTKLRLVRAVFLRTLGWIWAGSLAFAVVVSAATFGLTGATAPTSGSGMPLLVRSTLAMPALALFATWALVVGRQLQDRRIMAKLLGRIVLLAGVGMAVLAWVTVNPHPLLSLVVVAALAALFGALLNHALRRRYTASDLVLRQPSG